MPELPEVQTVINYLKNKILDKRINLVVVNEINSKIIQDLSVEEFKESLTNVWIKDIQRKGKYLLLYLSSNKIWIVHLRMSGMFSLHNINLKQQDLILNSTVALFYFDSFILRFDSQRKFSTFNLIDNDQLNTFLPLNKVNYDPLSNNVDANFLYNQIKNISRKIKDVLLDQSIISGIGNIYADEILYACRINPFTPSNHLNFQQVNEIIKQSKIILNNSIKCNGTTIHSYSFNGVDTGGYQKFLKVHHSKIKICPSCKSNLSFEKINGRGTYYCKNCQPLIGVK